MSNPFKIDLSDEGSTGALPDKFDVIIIGGGPAGLTAALYNARAGLKVLVLEKIAAGGQISITAEIENYPGIESISGPELAGVMEMQAKKFGAFFEFDEVEKIEDRTGNIKEVSTAGGKKYMSTAVIVAAGAKYREIGVPGEAKFRGRGVSNCATCDGAFFKGQEVAVIGGGDTAVEEGAWLTRFASRVHIIHRRDKLRAAKVLQDRAFANPKVGFIYDSVVDEISGATGVEQVIIKNLKTGQKSLLKVTGVFIFAGLIPSTDFLKGYIDMEESGYIKADSEMHASREGVFACGDCVDKRLRQAITAAGNGATAAFSAEHYVEKLKGTEYI